MTIKSLASESCNWLDSRLRGNDILVAQTDSSKQHLFPHSKNPIQAGRADPDEGRRLSD